MPQDPRVGTRASRAGSTRRRAAFLRIGRPCAPGRLEASEVDGLKPLGLRPRVAAQMCLGAVQDLEPFAARPAAVALPQCGFAPLPVEGAAGGRIGEPLARHQQPQVEFVLLAAGLVRRPAADIQQRLSPPEGRSGLRQLPARQQDPRIARFRDRHDLSPGLAPVAPIEHGDRAVEHIDGGLSPGVQPLALDLARLEHVIGVEILDPLSPRLAQQDAPGRGRAGIIERREP